MPIIRSYAESYIAQYRNILGANRIVQFDVRDEVECRNAVINELGHDIDEEAAPLRIEYFNADGVHTDTWTCDNVFDSDLRHQWGLNNSWKHGRNDDE